jgi:catechol 2,3-dioxygenase-like lactoylglutathione lyase family enzyme
MITGMPRIAIAVNDFPAVVSLFRDKFGMPVHDFSASEGEEYGAALAMCVPEGGSNIELMSPVDLKSPLSRSLKGFLDRRGEGLFALMLEAPVPDDEATELAERGLNVMPLMEGAFGRDVHPNSTHGVLIRVYPVNSFKGRTKEHGAESDNPRLSGIASVIVAVEDIDHAVEVYGARFNMAMEEICVDKERGVRSAICRPPTGGAIELVAAEDTSRPFANAIAQFIENDREGMYALVLQSPDVSATAKALAGRGLKVAPSADSADVLEVPREEAFGALIRIESA